MLQTLVTAAAPSLVRGQTSGKPETQHTPADVDPLTHLRAAHPRLILLDGEIDSGLRPLIRDNPLAKRIFTDLEKEAEKLQTTLPVEYKLTGTRLLAQSRRTLERVGTLALLFRLTAKESYLHRAILELKAAAYFKDWNPAHFLDTAEMTQAFAIGYDWLYPSLAFEDRAWIAGVLVNKGLDPALSAYQTKAAWTTSKYYWNLACNSGIVAGALAVAEDFPEKCSTVLKAAFDSLPHALGTWAPDGSWPEGPAYWDVATRGAAVLFSSVDSALGGEPKLMNVTHGLDRAGRFRFYVTGPTWKTFNFGDSPEEATPAPEMQWLARRFTNPVLAWQEQRLLERPGAKAGFYDLVWFSRETSRPPQLPQWPPDSIFHGSNVATFRSSWEDPNALFLAVKGGDNKVPHTHYDLGSFVLDAGGVRFASDLGPDEATPPPLPLSPPGTPQVRASSYRARTELHNTLIIDGENQDANAEAKIVRQEFAQDLSWVQLDLSKANGGKTKLWQRRVGMVQRQAVLVEDVVECDHPVDVVWGMLTDADITVNGQSAILQKGKWSLSAEIRSPRHAVFDQTQTRAQGYRKLIIRLGEKTTDLHLSVSLTPYKTGTPKPKITGQFPE